jgi:hypothetical protein
MMWRDELNRVQYPIRAVTIINYRKLKKGSSIVSMYVVLLSVYSSYCWRGKSKPVSKSDRVVQFLLFDPK